MTYRVAPIVLLLTASTVMASRPLSRPQSPPPLTVHEWGTFTSVAGEDGRAQEWLPRQAPGELPCFVERLPLNVKGYLPGTVRMETPVLYFYAPVATTVDVSVRFRNGVVTEWYPRARVAPAVLDVAAYRRPAFEGAISWSGLTVSPGASPAFLTEPGKSHYYQARATDAAPVRVGEQSEKFLFYRGVGLFSPPIEAQVDARGGVAVRTSSGAPLGDLVLFVNDRGRIGYQVHHATTRELALEMPSLEDEAPDPGPELEQLLVDRGLYPKEAAAMVNTWRDAWFEEGTRLFYLAPPAMVEEILPLDIRPTPASIVRAFVGRIELVTPAAMRRLETALVAGDSAVMREYGRFLQPIADRVLARADVSQRRAFEGRLTTAFAALASAPTSCR